MPDTEGLLSQDSDRDATLLLLDFNWHLRFGFTSDSDKHSRLTCDASKISLLFLNRLFSKTPDDGQAVKVFIEL